MRHLTIRRRAIPICWTPSAVTPPLRNGPCRKLQRQRKPFGERQPQPQSPGAPSRRIATGGHRSSDSGFGYSPIFERVRLMPKRKQRPARLVETLPDREGRSCPARRLPACREEAEPKPTRQGQSRFAVARAAPALTGSFRPSGRFGRRQSSGTCVTAPSLRVYYSGSSSPLIEAFPLPARFRMSSPLGCRHGWRVPESSTRAQRRKVLSGCHINELVERHAFALRHLARLIEKRELKPQCEIASPHVFLSNRLSASPGDRTMILKRSSRPTSARIGGSRH